MVAMVIMLLAYGECMAENLNITRDMRLHPKVFSDWLPGARTANGMALCH
jgi:hypothetical protein